MAYSNNEYIKLFRKLIDWKWFKDSITLQVFIFLLLRANWKRVEKNGIVLERGQVLTSVKDIATSTSASIRQTRTALEHLKSTNEVTIKTTNKFSVITIKNYSQYQGSDKQNDKQKTEKRQTTRHQIDKQSDNTRRSIRSKEDKNNISDVCVSNNNNNIYNTRARDGANSHTPTSPTSIKIPTAAQVADRLIELGTSTNIANFLEYNQARGWKTEWTYALDRWLEQDKARTDQNPGEVKKAFESERKNDYEAMERQLRRAQRRRAEGE